MVFSDLFFLFVFIPAFALTYLLAAWIDKRWLSDEAVRSLEARNMALVVFSLIFYAWGEPVYVMLMLGSVLLNYLAGRVIDSDSPRRRKWGLVAGLVCNLAILGTFKYAGFLAQLLCDVGLEMPVPHIALPIGISFFIFQSISYLVDVYRRESQAQRRLIDLLLYISMFPQLVAGPIVRYNTVVNELHHRHVSSSDVADGIYRFLIGLGKKVILANQFGEIADQFLQHGLPQLTTAGAWVGVCAFTLQIFFDFSGYSDMAIGMGRCMGFHFNENFDHPYCCRTITEFWRRWHMSLGSFFRDYVYIPLGGNRRHQAVNILVVWWLTGMWHGASWNFIIWGVYFGIIVMIEKYTVLRIQRWIPSPLLHLYSMLLVVVGWGIFYFEDFGQMTHFFNAFCGATGLTEDFVAESALTDHFWLWMLGLVMCLPVYDLTNRLLSRLMPSPGSNLRATLVFTGRMLVSLVLLVLSVALLVGATNNAFIYTRF